MVEQISVDLTGGKGGLRGGLFRYDVMERLGRAVARQSAVLLAFGFDDRELRLVLEGTPDAILNTLRGLKVGTVRAAERWGLCLCSGRTERRVVAAGALADAVAWAHRGPIDAGAAGVLESPWSSHRDLMGFRRASFYDAAVLDGRVDPRDIHARCSGAPLPAGWPPPPGEREDLGLLLRIAGAVLGVLPADRRCFRLFVHLARARGWHNVDIAEALCLTGRRVRQLAAEVPEGLDVALVTLADPRLCRVP